MPLDPESPADAASDLLARARPAALLYAGALPAWLSADERPQQRKAPPAFDLDALVAAGRGAAAGAGGASSRHSTPGTAGPAVPLHVAAAGTHEQGQPPAAEATPPARQEVAYVIFTSGSTGEPLGVLGTTEGLLNRVAWMQRAAPLSPGLAHAAAVATAPAFVDHVWEVFAPLLAGAGAAVLPAGWQLRPAMAARALAAGGVTHLVLRAARRAGGRAGGRRAGGQPALRCRADLHAYHIEARLSAVDSSVTACVEPCL
jgi:non-ribosomal peptide synthetase component F